VGITDHYYSNNKDSFDVDIYPVPRFSSEYGYQSMPCVSSWLTATDNLTDLNINSDLMNHRQHHPDGNDPLKKLTEFQLELPSEDNEFYDEAFIYYTQVRCFWKTRASLEPTFLDNSSDVHQDRN
jgi:beta-mannosidase